MGTVAGRSGAGEDRSQMIMLRADQVVQRRDRGQGACTRPPPSERDQEIPAPAHRFSQPLPTSAALLPPPSITALTLSFVTATGSSRIDGTSRLPSVSFTVPLVSPFSPLVRPMASFANAPASSFADL